MKNRSHRLPVSDPLDDWVDGSWTVDCVCGVNFDDGEEMVNCDECGVWVHTRCSRYVKSEKSFACDKCKSKNSRNDSEETEVAQLLVELPTKTLRMENPIPPPSGSGPPRRPFRLWTDIPMEERVHVQGIPGGDPALFGGFSSVFSSELWKCTGYVPKKFNFQYQEFPCWNEEREEDKKTDEQEEDKKTDERLDNSAKRSDEEHENPVKRADEGHGTMVNKSIDEKHENSAKRKDEEYENPANNGAGVLFSLSKENVLPAPIATLVDMKRRVEEGGGEKLAPSNGTKKREGEDSNVRRPHNGVKKDRSLLHPIVIYSGKRKKEEQAISKDQSGKKKARGVDKVGDSKKRGSHASKSVSTLSSDGKQLEFYEDRRPKVVKAVSQSSKHVSSRGAVVADSHLDGHRVVDNDVGDPKKNVAISGQRSEISSLNELKHNNSSIESRRIEENAEHQVPSRFEISSKTNDGAASLLELSGSGSVPIKEEVVVGDLDDSINNVGVSNRSEGINPHKSKPLLEDPGAAEPEVQDNQNVHASKGDRSSSSLQSNFEVKAEVDIGISGGASNAQSSIPSDVKLNSAEPLCPYPVISADHHSEDVKAIESVVANLQSNDHNVHDVDKSTVVGACQTDKADVSSSEPMQQLLGPEISVAVQKSSSELRQGSRPAEVPSKASSKILGPPVPPSQRKMVVSIGKSSSTSSTIVMSKPSVSDSRRPANPQNSSSSTKNKKDNAPIDVVRKEDGRERPKKLAKELPKPSFSSVSKTYHSSKVLHASVSKKILSDPKEPVTCSSSKTSLVQNNAVTPDSGESASSLQTENILHVQNKITAPCLPQKGEKVSPPNCQLSSKVNHTLSMLPPALSNSPATLSDEELALLLHQELNSSPRVPRVPRMRHAGNLPQLASPTATSTLMKRTSSSGGKDYGLVCRRKNKDLAKDGSRNLRELDDDAKKADNSRQDIAFTADSVIKEEADDKFAKGSHTVNRSIPPTTTANSGPSSSTEANEQTVSPTHNSPRNASDDDTDTVGRPTHRTLPGLIAEIMSKGKRMAYEELCNAVLPHWPNLRKHNGERYAYSSHSQAVLDCLRNRSEWARLVDRGPKTNASRKRRKTDAEPSSFESEDNEYSKDTSAKDVESKSFESHRDEFPKGKRKARKRRRLALQGRGVKDLRRRHKADGTSDDDIIGSFSNSTEETVFSEDEIQGGGACSVGCEASASSDETGTVI